MFRMFTIAVCLLSPTFALAVDVPTRTISTSGEATVFVVPDEVVLSVAVETANPNLDVATKANGEASARLVKAIKDMGVDERLIHTESLRIDVIHRNSSHEIEAYEANRGYSVTLTDIKKFEALVETALKNGANRINGFEYHTKELRKHRDAARAMAVRAAKEKAIALAKELGCQVGRPQTIKEESARDYDNRTGNLNYSEPGPADDGGSSTPVGQIEVKARASITFELTE